MTNHHRNGTYSMLLLKKLRAFHYFRRKRSGQVCGWRHREKHAVITKSTALTLLSFSLCYNFPHVFLHTLFHVLIPRHLVWQPPAAKCGSCTLEMWPRWIKMFCRYKRYIGFWRFSMKKKNDINYLINVFILTTCWNKNILEILGDKILKLISPTSCSSNMATRKLKITHVAHMYLYRIVLS